jgi:hypothetical protein
MHGTVEKNSKALPDLVYMRKFADWLEKNSLIRDVDRILHARHINVITSQENYMEKKRERERERERKREKERERERERKRKRERGIEEFGNSPALVPGSG